MNPSTSAPALSVISAIVTPALLILACSSLITATSNRLNRLLDRVRELTKDVEGLTTLKPTNDNGKRELLVFLLQKAALRARLIQRVMVSLYAALGALILTSVIVGVSSALGIISPVLIQVAIFTSVAFLFYGSALLIRESSIALSAVDAEMDYVRRLAG